MKIQPQFDGSYKKLESNNSDTQLHSIAQILNFNSNENQQVPIDLVIDHSVQVDVARSENAVPANMDLEFKRNKERRKKMKPGSLMKALIRPGAGDKTPSDGDQVIYHSTIRTLDGVIVESTKAEFGGSGNPKRQVLGKSKIILGLLEGIPTMLLGEVAMFKVKPELHYGEEDCPVSVADGFPKDDELHFEIELIDFSKN
ncbi:hypothetical protein ACS0TY_021599 [Phlomoides rotata]